MADLIIKPSAVGDEFKMNDANSSANTILTIEGQTDAATVLAGRIIYGKGVNETLGTATQASTVATIDLATGTFFELTLTGNVSTWQIKHLPAANTIAAWVVKIIQNGSSTVAYTGAATSTWDNGSWGTITPAFHWAGSTEPTMTTSASKVDIMSFWTKGGSPSVIYTTTVGQDFLT
jgi:hypothetical protein